MYRTLQQLQDAVQQLIEDKGPNSSCAAFLFTSNDVFYLDNDDDGGEIYLNESDADHVLRMIGKCDYIYEQVGEFIDDEVRRIRSSVTPQ
jgi:hypothetical protein